MSTRDLRKQIRPLWVESPDQTQFPRPVPFFELFLAADRFPDIVAFLVIDEAVDTVLSRESSGKIMLMFVDTSVQVRSDAHIQGAVLHAGQDIYEGGFHASVPKQQGKTDKPCQT